MKTWNDVYQSPPFILDDLGDRVYDSQDNFLFQFEIHYKEKEIITSILAVINGEKTFTNNELIFKHDRGYIIDNLDQKIILIRGWGNLTGVGGMNLPAAEAENIQDTLADFIVQQLNIREND